MIKIDKGTPPPRLVSRASNLRARNELQFDAFSQEYNTGQRKFDFVGTYKTKAIVEKLRMKQHNKCCFSEAKFEIDYPHVEHFRPKGKIVDYDTEADIYPGYYWLAYEWSNLFLCKSVINSTYKKNYFPLVDETQRNRDHHSVASEDPIIINPGTEDPRLHIQFHLDEPVGITERGKLNIKLLGLRHPSLEEGRRKLLILLKTIHDLIQLHLSEGKDIHDPELTGPILILREAIQPSAEFSSMSRDFLSAKLLHL